MTDTTTAGPAAAITTVDTYLAMWNEPDEARRADLIASAWTERVATSIRSRRPRSTPR